jgi:hypothetical protein
MSSLKVFDKGEGMTGNNIYMSPVSYVIIAESRHGLFFFTPGLISSTTK